MTPDERMANLKAAFATNGAPWDDRTEAALRSVLAAQGLEIAWWQMPQTLAAGLREGCARAGDRVPHVGAIEAWLDERYDAHGRPRG